MLALRTVTYCTENEETPENAFRASAGGEQVELELDSETDGMVRFRVLDSGIGMTEQECAEAVRRFWRRGKSGQGSGLGLSIVQAIAQRYGGSLRLSPRTGGGLCAELQLPEETRAGGPG
ncbi:hypothetical protein A8D65_25260 [Burkholderia cenocepacia]|nr:hypothetical protein A8D62_30040 [Burkholderia cenocepacia]ONN85918.1 hypothetical protein A8D63_20895 [Burkholderia cenocepacia]ONO24286.1 hypothetical protein A8D65_25260 [Burkholderia cenocepacia]